MTETLRRDLVRLALVAVLLGGCNLRQMLYPAPGVPVPSPPPAPIVEVPLAWGEGRTAIAWYAPAPAAKRSSVLVVYFHGNGENLQTLRWSGLFDRFGEMGVDVLAVDYPGYGRSDGEASEAGNLAVAQEAWAWTGQEAAGRRRVIVGWSLGAAVALQLAAERGGEVAGLIALSPWSSLPAIASVHYPSWLVSSLVRERYDSLSAAARITASALVVHGARDEIIPAAQGREVASRLQGPTRWVAIDRAGHNDLLGESQLWEEVGRFVAGL